MRNKFLLIQRKIGKLNVNYIIVKRLQHIFMDKVEFNIVKEVKWSSESLRLKFNISKEAMDQ